MLITIIILVLSAVFFVNGKIRSDLVALCALVALLIFQILTPDEALSGFSNSDNASSGVRMWKSSNKTKAHKATTSERILPLTKNTADKAKITNVTTIQPIF